MWHIAMNHQMYRFIANKLWVIIGMSMNKLLSINNVFVSNKSKFHFENRVDDNNKKINNKCEYSIIT